MSATVINMSDWMRDRKVAESGHLFCVTVTIMGVVVKQAYELDAVEAATFSIKEGKEIILRFSEIHPEMVEHTLNGVQSMNHLYMSDNSVTAKIVATISISVDKSFSS